MSSTNFANCEGNGAVLFAESSVDSVILENNQYRNMTDVDNYMFVSSAKNFMAESQSFDDGSDTMGSFNFIEGDDVVIQDSVFEGLSLGPYVGPNVVNAIITNCTFSNCSKKNIVYRDDWNFVIEIYNNKYLFDNNTIIFLKEERIKAGAILIFNNGDIKVINNRFINCYSGPDEIYAYVISPTIKFDPPILTDIPDQQVIFNYNFIQGVASRRMCLLYLNCINQNLNFDHNIFKNCINSNTISTQGYMGQIINIKTQEFILTNTTFEGCQSGAEMGGAIGIWFQVHNSNFDNRKISFVNCAFINNSHINKNGGGAFQMGGSSNSYFELLFEKCLFDGNSAASNGGALCFRSALNKVNKPLTIQNCIFENNKALGNYDQDEYDINGYGGAIFLNNDKINLTIIENCSFNNNYDEHGDGNAIYLCNSLDNSQSQVEIRSSCTFRDNYRQNSLHNFAIYSESPFFTIFESSITSDNLDNRLSAINFNGTDSVSSINNVTFENCCNLLNSNGDSRALAIDINYNTRSVEIVFCQFNNCGGNSEFAKYTIYDEGKETTIENCTFIGTATDTSFNRAPVIKVNSFGIHKIFNCHIKNPKCSHNEAVAYLPEDSEIIGNSQDENFAFNNVTIINADGDDCVAFYFCLHDDTKVDISDITIRNCTGGNGLVSLEIYDTATGFNFYKFAFIDNICSVPFGGGSGICINKHSQSSNSFIFQFIECSFIRNQAINLDNGNNNNFGNGGALQLSGPQALEEYFSYSVTNCTFEENKANKNGGAIEWHSGSNFIIEGCTFINNEATNDAYNGGAIYINPQNAQSLSIILITECTFQDNVNFNSSAIYIDESGASNCIVQINGNCQFIVNTKSESSLIRAKCNNLRVSDLSFDIKNLDNSIRAIYLESLTVSPAITNVTFRNCCCNKEGDNVNAIYMEKLSISNSHTPIISSCTFEDCGNKGWAVYSLDSNLNFRYNTITYTSNTKNQGGGGLYSTGGTIELFRNSFIRCYSSSNAGALFIGSVVPSFSMNNCTFKQNKSKSHGGAISINVNNASVSIRNCLFELMSNEAISSSSSELLYEKAEGRGAAIFISSTLSDSDSGLDLNSTEIVIENCEFKYNSCFDGFGIYIEGENDVTKFVIRHNNFTDNYNIHKSEIDSDIYKEYRSIITSEIFNLNEEQISTENLFVYTNNEKALALMYVDHYGNPIIATKGPTENKSFPKSDSFTKSYALTKSDIFTQTETLYFPQKPPPQDPFNSYSNVLSLTYVSRKSISYSISCFVSQTIFMSYDQNANTYVAVSTETNFQGHFPYIIQYMSPSYVASLILISMETKKRVTQEQLIGISCGSVSVFFLILGAIIMFIRKKNSKNQALNEFYDVSSSQSIQIIKENEKENDQEEPKGNNDQDDSSFDMDFWL